MNYLIDTHTLQHCELAFSLYNDSFNYSEIDSENNTLPIYKEIRDSYKRYNCAKIEQKKIEVRSDKIKSYPEIINGISESLTKLPEIWQAQAQAVNKVTDWLNGRVVTDEKTLMHGNTERSEIRLKDWLNRYERTFIKTYDAMIMPAGHKEKIWMYRQHIEPNEKRLHGLDIEAIAQVTAKEVRAWKFIIDNLPFYERYVFTENPYPDFDSEDTTNPLIFDYQLIVDLHRDFSNYLWNTIDIDNFKDCFRETPKKLEFHKNITIPEICYFFSKIEAKTTVVRIPSWISAHIGRNNYGKNKNELVRIESDATELKRNGFSLTIPQQKAIENKQKIDNLFNRILST